MIYEDPLDTWPLERLEQERELLIQDRQTGLLDWNTYKEAYDMVREEIKRRAKGDNNDPMEAYDRAMKGI